MNYYNYNGKVFTETEKIIGPTNRGLRYGDGIFETIKLKNGSLILKDEHFARFWKGLQLLQFDIPKLWSPEKLEEQILQLANKNRLASSRVRLTVIRSEGGLYDPKDNIPNYIIETIPLAENTGSLNENGLQMCIYKDAVKSIDAFSNIKHNNYLPYLMGALFAKKNQYNDALILNSSGNICDTTIANIFLIKNEMICTPLLSEGCVAGVMRKWLIEKIREQGFTVNEAIITEDDLMSADEVFLSNSIYNIRWVGSVENKKYSGTVTGKIAGLLLKNYPKEFC